MMLLGGGLFGEFNEDKGHPMPQQDSLMISWKV